MSDSEKKSGGSQAANEVSPPSGDGTSSSPIAVPDTPTRTDAQPQVDFLAKGRERLPGLVSELRKLLLAQPLDLTLSLIASDTFYARGEQSGGEGRPWILAEYPFWIFATLDESTYRDNSAFDPEKYLRIVHLVQEIAVLSSIVRRPPSEKNHDPAQEVLDRAQNFSLHVRGPSYPHHLWTANHALFSDFDADLLEAGAPTIAEQEQCLFSLVQLVSDRLSRCEKQIKAMGNHERTASDIAACAPDFVRHAPFTLKAAEAEELHPKMVSFLNLYALSPGQKERGASLPEIHDELELKPILKVGDVFHLQLFPKLQFAVRPNLESVLKRSVKAWHKYENTRARFLESQSVSLLAGTSPHAQGYSNLKYKFDDGPGERAYELDGLVVADNTLMLIEAKARALPFSARRSAPSTVEKLADSVGVAHEQALRASRYIRSRSRADFIDGAGNVVAIERAALARFIYINTTLDDYAAFVSRTRDLADAKLISAAEPLWSLQLTDLVIITEIIPGIATLVHYILSRFAVQRRRVYASEEIDYFGHYLHQRLKFTNFEEQGVTHVWVSSEFMREIDEFYLAQQGVRRSRAKPTLKIQPEIGALVREIEASGGPGFIDAAMALLDLTDDDVRQFLTMRKRHIADVRRGVVRSGFSLNDARRRHVVAYLVASESPKDVIADYSQAVKYRAQADRVVGIGEMIGGPRGRKLWFFALDAPWKQSRDAQQYFELVMADLVPPRR